MAGGVLPVLGQLAPVQANLPVTIDAYVGTVNGTPVFVDDVLQGVDEELRAVAKSSRGVGSFRMQARATVEKQVEIRISEILMDHAARQTMSEDDERRVEAYVNRTRKEMLTQFGGSTAVADQKLAAKGSSLEKEVAKKRAEVIRQLHLQKTLYPKIVVTRDMIQKTYDREKGTKYSLPAEVDLYTITIPISRYLKETLPDGTQQAIAEPTEAQLQQATNLAVERAKALIEQLKKGEEFAKLAEENSADPRRLHGGRWPKTRKGMLRWEEVEKAAFGLSANSIAEPVVVKEKNPADSLVMVVRVGEVSQARVVPFEEAQKDIERRLRETQYVTLTNQYYAKLREKSAVEGVNKMVDAAVDAAVARYGME